MRMVLKEEGVPCVNKRKGDQIHHGIVVNVLYGFAIKDLRMIAFLAGIKTFCRLSTHTISCNILNFYPFWSSFALNLFQLILLCHEK